MPKCSPNETFCGDTCVNTAKDPDNCGGCGVICPSGRCHKGECQDKHGGPK
jgi:hypothetical protein